MVELVQHLSTPVVHTQSGRAIYSLKDVHSCLNKVHPLSYDHRVVRYAPTAVCCLQPLL